MCMCLWSPEENVGPPGAGVTGDSELSNEVPCRSRRVLSLRHLCHPHFFILTAVMLQVRSNNSLELYFVVP